MKDMIYDPNDFWCYALPVSGGLLVSQLALLQEVYDARVAAMGGKMCGYYSYAPNIVFGSSGGNVASFIGQASDWTSAGIEKNSQHINSKLFLKKWVPTEVSFIPDIPFIFTTGSLYNKGIGANDLFKELFTTESIQRTEMWLGTYDIVNKKAQFFCNTSQANSYISEPFFNEEQSLYYAMPLKFTDGDLDMNADVCIASATIPGIVPSKEIDGVLYADGGVMYPSPLSVLNKEILRIVTGKERVPISNKTSYNNDSERNKEVIYTEHKEVIEKNLRLIYFFPYQPNGLEFDDGKKDIGIKSYLDSVLNVAMMQDRNTGIELINTLCPDGIETAEYSKVNNDELTEIFKLYSTRKHYTICLYPHRNPAVNIANADGRIVREKMAGVRNNYGCQIWYSKVYK